MSDIKPNKKRIREISQEILDILLEYRKKHPEFTFSLRSRDSVQSKEKRLTKGQWFQGANYIYIPLFKRGDTARKIKTIGFSIPIRGDGSIEANFLEISFKAGVNDPKEKEFHRELAERFGVKLNDHNHGIKFYDNPEDYIGNLRNYVEKVRPVALDLLKKYDIEKGYLVPEREFQRNLNRILNIKEQLKAEGKAFQQAENPDPENHSSESLNQILYGPPGTGKTYETINRAVAIANPAFDLGSTRAAIKQEYERLLQARQIVFTTFHQSLTYEDFIEGIKPMKPELGDTHLKYEVKDGLFKQICSRAGKTSEQTITIDKEKKELDEEFFKELYRDFTEQLPESTQNESEVVLKTPEGYPFELYRNSAGSITIKSGKKKTNMSASLNELTEVLFHDKKPTYPSYEKKIIEKLLEDKEYRESRSDNQTKNYILIIDEINRGNVSQIFGELITLIEEDKRLGKEEELKVILPYSRELFTVPPNLHIIGTMNTADRSVEALDSALRRRFTFHEMLPDTDLDELDYAYAETTAKEILQTINQRIEKLLDKDHCIGHSYFMIKEGEEPKGKLEQCFYEKIIPLLQEYFFGDYAKIGLVLGKGFITEKEDEFAGFAAFEGAGEYAEVKIYMINDHRHDEGDFEGAIKTLLNKSEPVD